MLFGRHKNLVDVSKTEYELEEIFRSFTIRPKPDVDVQSAPIVRILTCRLLRLEFARVPLPLRRSESMAGEISLTEIWEQGTKQSIKDDADYRSKRKFEETAEHTSSGPKGELRPIITLIAFCLIHTATSLPHTKSANIIRWTPRVIAFKDEHLLEQSTVGSWCVCS